MFAYIVATPGARLDMIRDELGIPSECARTVLIRLLKLGLVERRDATRRTLYNSPIYPSAIAQVTAA